MQLLPNLARRLGFERRVRFLGFSDDVPHELAQMHILVHASVDPEQFGLVVVEAMSAGVSVVAAAPGGPAEVIEDGVTGLLYPAGDVDALAQALRRFVADPALRSRLGGAAEIRSADFAPAVTAGKVLAVYERVASAPRPLSSMALRPMVVGPAGEPGRFPGSEVLHGLSRKVKHENPALGVD